MFHRQQFKGNNQKTIIKLIVHIEYKKKSIDSIDLVQ